MTALDARYRDTVAITGLGYAPYSRASCKTVLSLAVEAGVAAMRDAGLSPGDLGGIIDYQTGDSPKAEELGIAIGAPPDAWHSDALGGGGLACVVFAQAAMVLLTTAARHVMIFRAMNGRSGVRLGNFIRGRDSGNLQFLSAVGLEATPAVFAMLCQRHMHEYAIRPEHLGMVAVTQRRHASLNSRAILRQPISMAEYLASRTIATPFRLLDCCQESDGACAVILSRAEVARDMPQVPVYVSGIAYTGGPGAQSSFDRWPDFTQTSSHFVAPELWASAGCGPSDMSFAQLYDSFTWTVLSSLEAFGFCGIGESGSYIERVGIGLGSPLPVNTAGGLLSEAYIHGLNLVTEAVEQLRGQSGDRQVPAAERGLVTATGGIARGSAMVLRR